jgi:hypothetical protein
VWLLVSMTKLPDAGAVWTVPAATNWLTVGGGTAITTSDAVTVEPDTVPNTATRSSACTFASDASDVPRST